MSGNEIRLTPEQVAAEMGKPHLGPALAELLRGTAPDWSNVHVLAEGYYTRPATNEERMADYDYDDIENPQPPIELARKRLSDYVTEWGDGVVDSVQYDFRNGNSHDLHTRDIGALLQTLDRIELWAHDKKASHFYDSDYNAAQEHARNILRGLKPDGEDR